MFVFFFVFMFVGGLFVVWYVVFGDWVCIDGVVWFYLFKVLFVVFIVIGVLMWFDLFVLKMVMMIVFIVM